MASGTSNFNFERLAGHFTPHRSPLKTPLHRAFRILFPALSGRRVTGARYAEGVILRALRRRYKVETLYFDCSPLCRAPLPKELSYLLFAFYPYLVREAYDLVFTSDSYVYADLVYVQPPAGNVSLPVKDNIFFGENLLGSALRLLESPLDRMVRLNACFIANSKYTQELIRRFLGKPSELLYPPVPVHLYEAGCESRENLVVTIASLNPRKNLQMLPEVCERVPEAHFILIGYHHPQYEGLLKDILRRLAERGVKDRFTYIPSASERVKKFVLEKAKVLFHPTICEPFGISIVEGMAAGLIPVAHNSGGPREFVPEEWRYEEAEEAAEKIRRALKAWNPGKAEEMRWRAHYFREERFEAEVLNLVEAFLERKTSNPIS